MISLFNARGTILYHDIFEKGDTGMKEGLEPDYLINNRLQLYTVYHDLLEFFGTAIVGVHEYERLKTVQPISEWFSCTDEALVLVSLKNSWDR